jgi:hypothetical protein
MANTPQAPPVEQQDSFAILELLCLALRDVGVRDHTWTWREPSAINAVVQVQALYRELVQRGVDVDSRIARLSTETQWDMVRLLADCMAYPAIIPHVRDHNGIRRALLCSLCRERERPEDDQTFWTCTPCIQRARSAIQQRVPFPGIILFRTYSESARCSHADADTVVACCDQDDGFGPGFCERCLTDELARRQGTNA